jgi:uncharacterized SAM-binding protein YcdF (DUF218 family)
VVLLKAVVHVLILPSTLLLLALAVGLILRRRAERRRLGSAVLLLTLVLTYLSTTGLLGKAMMAPLERAYPPLADEKLPQVQFVSVLGSAYHPRRDIPITASLDAEGLARIVEGIRLLRLLPEARLVLSGGPPGARSPARGYVRMARELGVPEDRLILVEEGARDTASETEQVAARVGAEPFLLVTSAAHMPRAMRLMRRAGGNPVPAFATQRVGPLAPIDFLPRAEGLEATEAAFYEYTGLLAMTLGLD